jgi:multidrug efflux pump subunit AcrB
MRHRGITLLVYLATLLLTGTVMAAPEKPAQGTTRPVIVVEALYPGANAAVVADTVAAPIEQQIHGVERALYLASRSTCAGRYTLHVVFEPGVDPEVAKVLVQNRVNLAQPMLPDEVKRTGVSVRTRPADPLVLVKVFSPDGSRDILFLSRYATIQIQDELARVPGVAGITGFGQAEHSLRIVLDSDRLQSRSLTPRDVLRALESQNVHAELGVAGRPVKGMGPESVITVKSLDRVTEPKHLADLIIKTGTGGQAIRLRDVAHLEIGGDQRSGARHNGKVVAVLAVHPTRGSRPREVSAGIRDMLSRLDRRHPPGVAAAIAFDFSRDIEAPGTPTAAEYLLFDFDLPTGASPERIRAAQSRSENLLRRVEGVEDVLTLTEDPFNPTREQACVLVRLAPPDKRQTSRQRIIGTIRDRLAPAADMNVRVRDLSVPGGFSRGRYHIDLAVHGPEAASVRDLATKVRQQLRRERKLIDVWIDPASLPSRQIYLDIDRTQAKNRGVSLEDVFATLETFFGSSSLNDYNTFGRTWQVRVSIGRQSGTRPDDLRQLKVRNAKGEMVPLDQFVRVSDIEAPEALDRFDGEPMMEVTANPAPGVSLAEARRVCEAVAAKVRTELRLPAAYRLTGLQDLSER